MIAPTATTDSIKLLETGKVDFAILDIHDLAIADESAPTHPDIVGIMAIVAASAGGRDRGAGRRSPEALEGKTVGITGVPSDTAVLRSTVAGSGGDPAKVKTITIGFNAVADLLAGRVAGATAFWNDEGVTIQQQAARVPRVPGRRLRRPVLPGARRCARPAQTLQRDPALARGVVDALVRGYDYTLAHPQQAARGPRATQVAGLDPKLVTAQLTRVCCPRSAAADGRVGELDTASLADWAAWEARFGIVTPPARRRRRRSTRATPRTRPRLRHVDREMAR